MDIPELDDAFEREVLAADARQANAVAREPLTVVDAPDLPGVLRKAVDVYNGPDGSGYAVRLIYEADGQRWLRCIWRGPQAFRASVWNQLHLATTG